MALRVLDSEVVVTYIRLRCLIELKQVAIGETELHYPAAEVRIYRRIEIPARKIEQTEVRGAQRRLGRDVRRRRPGNVDHRHVELAVLQDRRSRGVAAERAGWRVATGKCRIFVDTEVNVLNCSLRAWIVAERGSYQAHKIIAADRGESIKDFQRLAGVPAVLRLLNCDFNARICFVVTDRVVRHIERRVGKRDVAPKRGRCEKQPSGTKC